jgi:hypothetical protein
MSRLSEEEPHPSSTWGAIVTVYSNNTAEKATTEPKHRASTCLLELGTDKVAYLSPDEQVEARGTWQVNAGNNITVRSVMARQLSPCKWRC